MRELDPEELLDIYETMILVRTLDERVWTLNRQGKAAIVASSQGHEAAQLGSVKALSEFAESYFCFTYYRDMGVCVAQGLTPKDVLLGFLAKEGEPISDARQFPLHGASKEKGFMNLSNVVGTHVPHAVGWALASKINKLPTVTAVYFGDGAASQGEIHEAMNFAAIHKLPVIFLCENNRYAISVPIEQQMAITNVADRAQAYGMPGYTVDGTDIQQVFDVTAQATIRASEGEGPTLIEYQVERYLPHTSDDDDSTYRTPEDIEKSKQRDPLKKLRELLLSKGVLNDKIESELIKTAKEKVNSATEFAEKAPYPKADDVLEHVYDNNFTSKDQHDANH